MSDDKYKVYAEKIKIFNGLKPQEVKEILQHGKVIQYHEGQTIFHEGMLGSNLFVVLSGSIAIFRKNKQIAQLSTGDAFGEMSVLNQRPRSATAAALKSSNLLTLDERQINEMLQKHVAVRILLNIIHILSERLETANTHIADLRR